MGPDQCTAQPLAFHQTSCDDTSVAVAEISAGAERQWSLRTLFHRKITANNEAFSGIHPVVALESHQESLAPLVKMALDNSSRSFGSVDLVCATRGPGMRSNLSCGLDTAKGLALGLRVPFIGVHHMQAHALTPRLVSAMRTQPAEHLEDGVAGKPMFPFLTALLSGGHTMLLESQNLVEHRILAETQDIALGDCLDKVARAVVPTDRLSAPYGKALEDFAFPNGEADFDYTPPYQRRHELETRGTSWAWSLSPPISKSGAKKMIYSFSGLLSAVERIMRHPSDPDGQMNQSICRDPADVTIAERRELAREAQRVAFEHFASRMLLYLESHGTAVGPGLGSVDAPPPDLSADNIACLDLNGQKQRSRANISTLVVSGGVASSAYLRHVLRRILDVRGFPHLALNFPSPELCTDNALMIAWAGWEMFQAGYRSRMDVRPLRKWSMDSASPDGGILGTNGRNFETEKKPELVSRC